MKKRIIISVMAASFMITALAGCGAAQKTEAASSVETVKSAADSHDLDDDECLIFHVISIDGDQLTGDMYHQEKIEASAVENAKVGDILYSEDGTEFRAVDFEEANETIQYTSVEDLKADAVPGDIRWKNFLLYGNEDKSIYSLEKEEDAPYYNVSYLFTEGTLEKLIADNLTYTIPDDASITLQVFVNDQDGISQLTTETMTGKEFTTNDLPEWSENAPKYYMLNGMIGNATVSGDKLVSFSQIYRP
jgi:hypothetical protein